MALLMPYERWPSSWEESPLRSSVPRSQSALAQDYYDSIPYYPSSRPFARDDSAVNPHLIPYYPYEMTRDDSTMNSHTHYDYHSYPGYYKGPQESCHDSLGKRHFNYNHPTHWNGHPFYPPPESAFIRGSRLARSTDLHTAKSLQYETPFLAKGISTPSLLKRELSPARRRISEEANRSFYNEDEQPCLEDSRDTCRDTLKVPIVPFRFCHPLTVCRIPRASIRCKSKKYTNNSSAAKVDRPYCGPGPPGRNRGVCVSLNKNHGLDAGGRLIQNHHHGPITNGNHHHLGRRHQAVSQSAVMGSSRHGSRGVAVDDCGSRDRWRRNGGQREAQSYELSQDLADKRLEMLERRYGGDRARRAATTIQRAYRHYAMHKKFRAITATAKAQEKRLSRRFTVDASNDWASDSANTNGHPFDAEQRIRSEFDKLNRNLNATVYGENRRPSRSLSMRDSSRGGTSPRIEVENLNDTSLYCHSSHNTTTTTTSPSSTPITNGTENNHPQNFSGDSNSYASSRELKYLTSDDSGFGSQEPVINKCTSSNRSKSSGRGSGRKVPPEVPRRTSSIKSESSGSADSFVTYNHRVHCAPPSLTPPSSHSSHSSEGGSDRGALRRSADNGSLSSVQSSGSDSSLSQSNSDRGTPLSNQEQQEVQEFVAPTSPVWKRKTQISEVLRKRQYRVGLNLFNKKPERGVNYLIGRGFLENSPQAVAKFLLTRKGLSKQMIGEYLGNLQNQFNMSVLESFATEIDLSGVQVDVALRKFQTLFRMPGEAQKIERLMQVFAQRYCQCNRDIVSKLHDPETIFVLAFAIIMLNTDLHTASLKPEKRMKLDDFVKNLRGIDDGFDIEREMLEGMYQRIKDTEFRPGNDHVTQVLKVQQTVVGKKPVLALPHRRLVCYCRLYEIPDPNKKERSGLHQREVFLFNDLLVITKIFSKKKNSITYTFRESFPLAGLQIQAKETLHYPYLLEVRQRVDNKVLIMLNARNEHDRTKFCEDLRESILEMDEMENLRIEGELERQKANLRASRPTSTAENRDSGVADMELITPGEKSCSLKPEGSLKRTTLSNSLLDIHEAGL